MKKTSIFILVLLFNLSCLAQNRSNWTLLDYLNQDPEYHFQAEKDIKGLYFITLSDSFDYYQTPIIVKDKENEELVKIEFIDTLGILTTFKGIKYMPYDSLNPFNPWLWRDNTDYFRLAFECTDTVGKYYKVWLNDNEFALLNKSNNDFRKETINEFVLSWTAKPMGLDFNRETNPLKRNPNKNSEIISHQDQDKYKIWRAESIEIEGDWMKVITIKDEVGWIKWKDGVKVLIKMYYTC